MVPAPYHVSQCPLSLHGLAPPSFPLSPPLLLLLARAGGAHADGGTARKLAGGAGALALALLLNKGGEGLCPQRVVAAACTLGGAPAITSAPTRSRMEASRSVPPPLHGFPDTRPLKMRVS